ncbi:hypothetical protein NHX12_009430 [Muraenolepis orangiensis]|uniref:ZP domain-containing protein n=1 Tax=Muraenolepis orangiensis TaxID=630683 RepID=A0A9Q0DNC8_9TELE|nr:hypothetical protein NHX12_009430 [Muraenolepis orangiensis]
MYFLITRCNLDEQTKVELNGVSQMANFSFEAFRFVEHRNNSISTFFVHCITRLCAVEDCPAMSQCEAPSERLRRDVTPAAGSSERVTATVTSPPIIVSEKTDPQAQVQTMAIGRAVVGLGVAVALLVLLFGGVLLVFLRSRKTKK